MPDDVRDEQIAAARYALIAPIVSRQTPLAPGELKRWLRETADRRYELPGSRKQTVSERTLERYLEAYRKGGWDALKPKNRSTEGRTKLDPGLLQQAIALRRERPAQRRADYFPSRGKRRCFSRPDCRKYTCPSSADIRCKP